VRLYHLGSESLWYDETVSVYLATQPLPNLIAHTARDIHPPAYYLLLHAWRLLANPTVAFGLEYLYAWPSLCLAMMVMALTYVLARRFFGKRVARWALAIALLHPFQVWFAQEVRMYALGAFCLMLSLWAVSPLLLVPPSARLSPVSLPRRMFALYLFAALLGLYTLYYFLFWLVILNLAVLLQQWRNWRGLRTWFLLQFLLLLGWLPWLPTFLHQAATPPVPAWRVPWQNATEMARAASEGLAALFVGHTPALSLKWPWTMGALAAGVAFFVYTKSVPRRTRIMWLLLAFGPLAMLLGVSLIGPPIYHVRYVATYAPIFVLLLGALLAHMQRGHALFTLLLVTAVGVLSLDQLWSNPRFAADDHRAAVATLARQWRPGDAILVNAGWVYTALSVYWPTELPTPTSTRPPPLAATQRLTEVTSIPRSVTTTLPVLFRTGSIDGPSSLGWGLPESDFFSISASATTASLEQLAASHARVWHYRLYDTVNDPNAYIRTWLNDHTTLEFSQSFPGEGYLLLEGYHTPNTITPAETTRTDLDYADAALRLATVAHAPALPAGEMLYVHLTWQASEPSTLATTPAVSLRLQDASGNLLLQNDTPVTANPAGSSTQAVALPIPASMIPGDYTVSLVLYAPETLAPYTATTSDGSQMPVPAPLGQVAIGLPTTIPHTQPPFATFDYIDLLQVELPTTPLAAGASFNSNWTWRPHASDYRDHYSAHLQLIDAEQQTVAAWDFVPGGEHYPSSIWPPAYPITHRVSNELPPTLRPGTYKLLLSLTRTSDGHPIAARQPWRLLPQPAVKVGQLEIGLSE
jgi:hypothetical protein